MMKGSILISSLNTLNLNWSCKALCQVPCFSFVLNSDLSNISNKISQLVCIRQSEFINSMSV